MTNVAKPLKKTHTRYKLQTGRSHSSREFISPLYQDQCDPSPCHIRTAAFETLIPVNDLLASALSVALITAVIANLSPSLTPLLHHLSPSSCPDRLHCRRLRAARLLAGLRGEAGDCTQTMSSVRERANASGIKPRNRDGSTSRG